MSDKPGATTLEQLAELRRVQRETGRIYSILYSERLESRATVRAATLVRDGAIGEVVQTIGLGPHRVHPPERPDWFWERERYGGILCDIGSHQFDQFLHFTGATKVDIVAAQVRNVHHPDRPGFQDFGDVMLRSDRGSGYIRLDWFTPAGLPTWGDGRLTVLGTDGYMELRKYVDLAGRRGRRPPLHRRREAACATRIAAASSCRMAGNWWTMCSPAPRRRCRRHTASWRWSSRSGRSSWRSREGAHDVDDPSAADATEAGDGSEKGEVIQQRTAASRTSEAQRHGAVRPTDRR